MNKERILAVADAIEKAPHASSADMDDIEEQMFRTPALTYEVSRFNMCTWKCGTVGCIGGWVRSLYPPKEQKNIIVSVCDALGIDSLDARRICIPMFVDNIIYSDITPAQAAQVLRKFAETGVVDWSHVDAHYRDEYRHNTAFDDFTEDHA